MKAREFSQVTAMKTKEICIASENMDYYLVMPIVRATDVCCGES